MSWDLRPNPNFNHLLLSITSNDKFEDLFLVFYIWILNTTIEVIVKKHFLLLLGIWPPPQKKNISGYRSTFLVHFTMIAPMF